MSTRPEQPLDQTLLQEDEQYLRQQAENIARRETTTRYMSEEQFYHVGRVRFLNSVLQDGNVAEARQLARRAMEQLLRHETLFANLNKMICDYAKELAKVLKLPEQRTFINNIIGRVRRFVEEQLSAGQERNAAISGMYRFIDSLAKEYRRHLYVAPGYEREQEKQKSLPTDTQGKQRAVRNNWTNHRAANRGKAKFWS